MYSFSKRYKYRFIINKLLFSSSIQKETNIIFIVADRLNNAKEVLIDGKIYQVIGLINISQIKGWENIKNTSHWVNTVFNDSQYPKIAQHLAFAFETTDLRNLLNFEYSLLDDEGKFIKFKKDKDKIPALNLSIQKIRKWK